VLKFQSLLIEQNFSAFIRQNRATDILGACGQLAAQSAKVTLDPMINKVAP
jgi:23S rRNA (adenine2503-C2)-methyltransferase